jgi:putative PIN family toxin of toxin-antitoxin system
MIRVVLDTNVLVSALISSQGPNARLFDMVLSGEIQPCVSEDILTEYRGVFVGRPKFRRLSPSRITALIDLLDRVSVKVTPRAVLKLSSHEPDNRIYECAEAARARYIVTGNRKHFAQSYKCIEVVNSRQLLDLLAAESGPGR